MSYHLGRFSQADWFYGKETPTAGDTSAPTGPTNAPAPSAPAPTAPTPSPMPATSPTTPPPSAPAPTSTDYEEESGGINMFMIAGVSALVLAGILIYFKFSGGSDETVYEEIEEVSPEPEAAPEPEKKKGKTITVEIQTDDE